MYNKKDVNKKVIKAISVGLATMMAVQPVMAIPANAVEPVIVGETIEVVKETPSEIEVVVEYSAEEITEEKKEEIVEEKLEEKIEEAVEMLEDAKKEALDPAIVIDIIPNNNIEINIPLTADAALAADVAKAELNGVGPVSSIDKQLEKSEEIVENLLDKSSEDAPAEGKGDTYDKSGIDDQADGNMDRAEGFIEEADAIISAAIDAASKKLSEENIADLTEEEANIIANNLKEAQASAQTEADKANDELKLAENELKEAQIAYDLAGNVSESEKAAVQARLDAAQAAVNAAAAKATAVNNVVTTINGYIDTTSDFLHGLQPSSGALVDLAGDNLKDSIDDLKESVDSLKETSSELAEAGENFISEAEDLAGALDDFVDAILDAKDAQDHIEDLKDQYETAVNTYNSVKGAYEKALNEWNNLDYDNLEEGEDPAKMQSIIDSLENAMSEAETAMTNAKDAFKDFKASNYAKTITSETENYNSAKAENDEAGMDAAAKAMAKAVIEKEFTDGKEVVFATDEDGFGKSENGFFYFVNENGVASRWTYVDNNGSIEIYELQGETDDYVSYGGKDNAVVYTKDENGNVTKKEITVDDKTYEIKNDGKDYVEETIEVTTEKVNDSLKGVKISGYGDTTIPNWLQVEISIDDINRKNFIVEELENVLGLRVEYDEDNNKFVYKKKVETSEYEYTGEYDTAGLLGYTDPITGTYYWWRQSYPVTRKVTFTSWEEIRDGSVKTTQTYNKREAIFVDGIELIQNEDDTYSYTKDGETYNVVKNADGTYAEKKYVTITAGNVADTEFTKKNDSTGKSSSQYATYYDDLEVATIVKANEYQGALNKYDAANGALTELANQYAAYVEAKAEYERTDLNVKIGTDIDLGLFGDYELVLGNGDLSKLPVDLGDVIDMVKISNLDDVDREKVLNNIKTIVDQDSSQINKLFAIVNVMSALGGENAIGINDVIALMAAVDPSYVEQIANDKIDELIPGNDFISKEAKEALKKAAKGFLESNKNNLVSDFQREYATAWLNAFETKIAVVEAGIELANETVDVVKASVDLAKATGKEIGAASEVALDSLKVAVSAMGYGAAVVGDDVLGLATVLVDKLDKYVDDLNKETKEAKEAMDAAQAVVNNIKVNAPGSDALAKAEAALAEAQNRFNNLNTELSDANAKLAEAKEQQKIAEKKAEELKEAREAEEKRQKEEEERRQKEEEEKKRAEEEAAKGDSSDENKPADNTTDVNNDASNGDDTNGETSNPSGTTPTAPVVTPVTPSATTPVDTTATTEADGTTSTTESATAVATTPVVIGEVAVGDSVITVVSDLPTAGVAGARKSSKRAAAAGENTGIEDGNAIDETVAGGEEKIDEADTKKKDEVKKDKKESKKAVTIQDEDTPLSDMSQKKMNWWWLLLVALGIATEETYRRNKNKKDEMKIDK